MPTLSIVVPCYNEEKGLPALVERVRRSCSEFDYELILVNDGSRDSTCSVAISLSERHSEIKVVDLARNFGHQLAVTAGLEVSEGDAVVIIDADLQDPPEVIARMVEKWREGFDVVYGQRKSRLGETKFKLGTAFLFYRLLKISTSIDIPLDTGDFRLMDRKVVDELKKMGEHHRYLRGMVSWLGFRQTAVMYERQSRFAGASHYPFWKMFRFAMDGITSFSLLPLRMVFAAGFLLWGVSLFQFFALLWGGSSWSSIGHNIVLGLQFMGMGIIGEYLGRVYEEVKARPLYVIRRVISMKTQKNREAA